MTSLKRKHLQCKSSCSATLNKTIPKSAIPRSILTPHGYTLRQVRDENIYAQVFEIIQTTMFLCTTSTQNSIRIGHKHQKIVDSTADSPIFQAPRHNSTPNIYPQVFNIIRAGYTITNSK